MPSLADKQVMIGVEAARAATRMLVDFALPPRCPGCGLPVAEDRRFCLECWQSLDFLGEPCCSTCALPFDYNAGEEAQCASCMANPPAFDRLRAAVVYGETARKVALKLKYNGRPGVAETLAHFMQRHLAPASHDNILIPVPLHRWRIWKRGYNQSALIAQALAKRSKRKVELEALRRVKATPVLRGLGKRQRALAVRGAFKVAENRKQHLSGQDVTLVDDVFTSGATADACAKALKRAGVARVDIICWARVLRIGED